MAASLAKPAEPAPSGSKPGRTEQPGSNPPAESSGGAGSSKETTSAGSTMPFKLGGQTFYPQPTAMSRSSANPVPVVQWHSNMPLGSAAMGIPQMPVMMPGGMQVVPMMPRMQLTQPGMAQFRPVPGFGMYGNYLQQPGMMPAMGAHPNQPHHAQAYGAYVHPADESDSMQYHHDQYQGGRGKAATGGGRRWKDGARNVRSTKGRRADGSGRAGPCVMCLRQCGGKPWDCPAPTLSRDAALKLIGSTSYARRIPADTTEMCRITKQAVWLKTMRLHKYGELLIGTSWKWISALTEERLLELGLTEGASNKFLGNFGDVAHVWQNQPSASDEVSMAVSEMKIGSAIGAGNLAEGDAKLSTAASVPAPVPAKSTPSQPAPTAKTAQATATIPAPVQKTESPMARSNRDPAKAWGAAPFEGPGAWCAPQSTPTPSALTSKDKPEASLTAKLQEQAGSFSAHTARIQDRAGGFSIW